ncbi:MULTISPECIES: STAS domain-containing protein [unclassified Streptomyces]|uniref:STAS domain-containing protein n=1 Tax=unclassified Streptomyces TaxID=2593676 RepID=UPI000F78A0AF|nr:STAS domain-containing protein [Streptomyces sp. WAC08241]RSS42644.1 anti-sigma factor antagonist [Streptomyces sp. WAC08241]
MSDHDNTARPGRLSVTHRTVEGVRIVSLRGEIDHTSRDVLGEALLSGDAAVTRVVADLGGVSFMDSSGINVLITAHRQIDAAGGKLHIAAANEAVLRVLTLVGVDTFIPCHPTTRQALSA